MPRSLDEWIGKTVDTPVPPRVRLRNLQAHNFVCHISGAVIDPVRDAWQTDHVIAIIDGGENRERNLAPALGIAHKRKTAAEVKRKAKVDRVAKKHCGIKSNSAGRKLQSRGFQKVEKDRPKTRKVTARRPLFGPKP